MSQPFRFRRWKPWLGMGLVCLALLLPNRAAFAFDPSPVAEFSSNQVATLEALSSAQVVYLGETHDSPADHAAQLEIIQALVARNGQHRGRPIAIALEMFQRPFQPALDDYLAGNIDEQTLLTETEYEQRWGFPWEYYAPILRLAKDHQLPLLALNTPTEVTHKVARSGLGSLGPEDQRYIPPLSEIHTDNAAYRSYIEAIFNEIHGDLGSAMSFENFFAAQVLWDETMADAIATFLQQNPDYQVIVLTGQGHVIYGYGICDRVARRLEDDLTQQIVLLNPDETIQAAPHGIANHFWFSSSPPDSSKERPIGQNSGS
ncbi:MAG TPA: ChaN family lipoprotein [Leptolyngbyaceae cyanobacterium]